MIRAIQLQNKRVGSTFLQRAMDSHPDIVGIDEVFVNNIRKDLRKSGFVPYVNSDLYGHPDQYMKDVINMTYPDKNTIVKVMYNQLDYHHGLMQYIKESNMPIIHVRRFNLLQQVISYLKMALPVDTKIDLPASQIYEMVKQAENDAERFDKYFRGQIRIQLWYEDFIDGQYFTDEVNKAICTLFKVGEFRMFANTKKRLKEDISCHFKNFDEIRRMFKGGRYEWMLEMRTRN